jgi:hypothetical protein
MSETISTAPSPQTEKDRLLKIEERLDQLAARYNDLAAKVGAWQQLSCHPADWRQRFNELVTEWRRTRGHSSKIKDLVMNPAYQKIIGMGEPAIPLILEELERQPDHWSWALTAISGDDPIPTYARGRLDETTSLWLQWGREKRYR